MQILRNITAQRRSIEMELVDGTPVSVSVDDRDIEESWRFEPKLSASQKLKLTMNNLSGPDILDKIERELTFPEFDSLLRFGGDRPLAVDPNYIKAFSKWAVQVVEDYPRCVDRAKLNMLGESGPATSLSVKQIYDELGYMRSRWFIYNPDFMVTRVSPIGHESEYKMAFSYMQLGDIIQGNCDGKPNQQQLEYLILVKGRR